MIADWETAIAFVLQQEGGYTVDPNDPGGETIFGISRKNFPNWEGWAAVDSMKGSTDFPSNANGDPNLLAQAKTFYSINFWAPCHGDELPTPYAIAILDTAVNQGVKTAIRMLQITLDVDVDGIMGSQTISAAFKAGDGLVKKFLAERLSAYARLMAGNQNLFVFAINWFYRVLSLAKLLWTTPTSGQA